MRDLTHWQVIGFNLSAQDGVRKGWTNLSDGHGVDKPRVSETAATMGTAKLRIRTLIDIGQLVGCVDAGSFGMGNSTRGMADLMPCKQTLSGVL